MTDEAPAVVWADHRAVLFDLDGVLTPTAEVHMRAWSEMFNGFLGATTATATARPTPTPTTSPTSTGSPATTASATSSPPAASTCPRAPATTRRTRSPCAGLGNRKNDAFNEVLARDGVAPYPGSLALLDHLRDLGLPLAVVSSSANAPAVLAAAGIADRFETVVDGRVADAAGLPGKPAPDTFLHAASQLDVTADDAVVLEDAVSGVRAGAAGRFGLVIGVDRGAGDALRDAGATLVVSDLAELVPGGDR